MLNASFPLVSFAGTFAICLLSSLSSAQAGVVINELLYRPGTAFPENTGQEFIELLNTEATAQDISGWAFTRGVTFTFPAGTTIPAGGYVVVASNPAAVQSAFGITGIYGPWTGTLSNNDESITLSKPGLTPGTFVTESNVHYASEGDWATRVRETTFNGWEWSTPANGGGRSVELRNPALSNDSGQNWAASTAAALATPGRVNSVATTNVPPIIRDVKHSPAVPTPAEQVTISCRLTDETASGGLTATLFWRNATGTTPGAFQTVSMAGDGDGKFEATLGALPHLSIVEFYISATDGTSTRTWPASTSEGQNANAQYQVSNEVFDPNEIHYLLVLTGQENAAYEATAPQDNAGNKIDRQFNTTVIVAGGTGASIRYQSSIRFRGNSSRSYRFKPLRVSIPLDNRLDGVSDFNLHPRGSYIQYIGFRAFQAAGVRVEDAVPVELRRNGVEYTSSTGGTPDFGKWVRIEDIGGDFVDNHWPEANGGNAYRKTRPDQFWRATQPAPSDPNALLDGWSKQNNSSANDWSDLTTFFQTWQTAAAPHFTGENSNDVDSGTWNGTAFSDSEVATLSAVSDFDQWARWFAVMTILQDFETNISNGQDDDYAAYFEPNALGQRRMHLIPHDLDTVLGRGDTQQPADARGLYDMTDEASIFSTLLPLFGNNTTPGNAAFRAKYHTAIRELYGTVFNASTTGNLYPPFYAFLDNHLAGWVPTGTIDEIKSFATQRQAHLLGLIGSGPIIPPPATSTATLASAHGSLMISEVLASNVAASQNGATFPDVIELHNSGSTDVDVGGMSLSDDPAVPDMFILPAGTTIPAGGFLLVYADADAAAPGLHAGFALDQDGDQVRLYDSAASGGTLRDAIVFGPQATDLSISRTGAARDVWALTSPTLGAVNGAPLTIGNVGGVRINEILTNPDYLSADDFLEIYNPATQPVALGGLAVTDDFINYPARSVLPALSFIGARGFLALRPKGDAASPGNPTELPFKFSATTAVAAILGANGTMIDQLDINSQPPDVSRGREPDGAAALRNFGLPSHIPTPGGANVAPPAGILALLNQLRVTELLYRPNTLEYLELQNVGATSLDISGVRFTSGLTYTFPAGTILAPGAFIVVCKDRAAFIAQFGGAVPLAPGAFTGTLDNAGETIAFQPPPPWNVNILNFEYSSTWYVETTADHSLVLADPVSTVARDWDEQESWTPSAQPYGNPGIGPPPSITSPLAVLGVANDLFSYQITATGFPSGYTATNLPAGLVLNPSTGLISGTPTALGVINVEIGASNAVGADSKTLVVTIADSGPLASFAWAPIGGTQTAGQPFTVTLRAQDSSGRTVSSFNGPAQVSAQRPSGTATVVFTEFGTSTPTPDYFEIENVGSVVANTTGWFVVTNSSPNGVNAAATIDWPLPASVDPGQLVGATDGTPGPTETPYGGEIDWPGQAPNGWAMLVDNTGAIRDFVAWGYTGAEIASINLTHSGFTFTIGTQWSGNGASTMSGGQSLSRGGASDNNTAADWSLGPTPTPRGTQNGGLTVPWSPPFTPVPSSPTGTVNLVNGVWSAPFSVFEIGTNVELHAAVAGQPLARSNSFTVVASTVNTPPSFNKGPDQVVPEDAGVRTVSPWATGIRIGASNETGQTVSFLVTNDNPALFASQPVVQSNGTLTFAAAPNAYGNSTVTLRAQDNGGTANGGVDTSEPQTFTITVLPINDPPTLTITGNLTVSQLVGAQAVPLFATEISSGPANESGQAIGIRVTNSNPALFSSAPALAADGTLTFTPSPNASGTAIVSISVSDDGGTASGGSDTTQRSFTITTLAINKPPTFTAGPNVIAPITVSYARPWATNISPGGGDESSQTLTFSVTTDHPELFNSPPSISPAGQLSFAPRSTPGTAVVTVVLRDNGGTAQGGNDSSLAETFTIQITTAANAQGTYRGLVAPPGGSAPAHGRFGRAEFTVTATARFTGTLILGGKTYRLKGLLDNSGSASFGRDGTLLPLARKGLPPLLLSMQADVGGSAQRITGQVLDGSTLFAEFAGDRDAYDAQRNAPIGLLNPSTDAGNYTGIFAAQPAPNGGLPASGFPQGEGWTVLTLTPTGEVKVRGRFADGSKFKYASGLNSSNGFPFYVSLYHGKGAVAGEIVFNTTGVTHLETPGLIWFRPTLSPKQAPQYSAGWPSGILIGFQGAARNLVSEPAVLPPGAATLTLAGGNLSIDGLSKSLNISADNRVTVSNPALDKMQITLKPSGEWSGRFVHPVSGKRTTLEGVVLRTPTKGAGYFLGVSESGKVEVAIGP